MTRSIVVSIRFVIIDEQFDADAFVRSCPLNMTGADFYALASDAYLRAIQRLIINGRTTSFDDKSRVTLIKDDFDVALANFTPSLNINDIQQYERLQTS
jgi:peroxin-6